MPHMSKFNNGEGRPKLRNDADMAVAPTASDPAESKSLPKVGNELLCIEAVDDSLSVRSERADGADTRRHFVIVKRYRGCARERSRPARADRIGIFAAQE